MKLYVFRTVRLSIIRSLFTVHSAMVYVIQVCRQLSSRSCSKAVYKPVWHTIAELLSRARMEPVPSWSCSKAVYKPVWHILLLSFRAGLGWNQFHPGPALKLSTNLYDIYHCWAFEQDQDGTGSILVLLESCLQTCMTYTIAELSSRTRMEPVPSWSCSKAVYKPVW